MRYKQKQYTLLGKPFIDGISSSRFVDHTCDKHKDIQIVASEAKLSLSLFHNTDPIVADLLELAALVYAADKLATHPADGTVSINVHAHLRNPQVFDSLQSKLSTLLYWMTDCTWNFTFVDRRLADSAGSQQQLLPLIVAKSGPPQEVALWSGGLDSLAGLSIRKQAIKPEASLVLCSLDLSNHIRNIQKSTQSFFFHQDEISIPKISIPVRIRYQSATGDHEKNHLLRSRGFLFLTVGAALAHSLGLGTLHVYENGIGAINLPYLSSKLISDHSRGVHPKTLQLASDVISSALSSPISILNPFVFNTKAQMCCMMPSRTAATEAASSNSCDSRPRRKGITACGTCASCILRQQALFTAKIQDQTTYHHPAQLGPHFGAIEAQANAIQEAVSGKTPWETLLELFPEVSEAAAHIATAEDPAVVQSKLIELYKLHYKEWRLFASRHKISVSNRPR